MFVGGHWLCKMLGIINTCIHTNYAPTSSHRAVVRLFIWFLLDKWWEKHWYNNSLRDPIALCFHKYSKQVVYYHHVPLQREFLWYKCVWESGERQRGWCFITSLLFMVKEKIMWGEKKHTEQGDISAPVPHFRLAPFINAFPNERGLFESEAANRWSSLTVYLTQDIEKQLGDPLRLGLTCHHGESVPRKGPSLSQWRAPQSGYGSVLTAIWLEILLSSSCCGDMLADFHLRLIAVKDYVFRPPWEGSGLKATLSNIFCILT